MAASSPTCRAPATRRSLVFGAAKLRRLDETLAVSLEDLVLRDYHTPANRFCNRFVVRVCLWGCSNEHTRICKVTTRAQWWQGSASPGSCPPAFHSGWRSDGTA